jgi:flagellar hook-basal body complex protein FliE
MKTQFNWGDDIIDSREVIARYDELNDEYTSLAQTLEDAQDNYDQHKASKSTTDELTLEEEEDFENTLDALFEVVEEAQKALDEFNQSFDKDELDTLTEVIRQGEEASDWSYGEGLIHESYFTQYTEDLIKDCYELPKEFESGKWPWKHMTLDYEGAAEEAKSDYSTIDVEGHTYYIRQ